MFFLKSWVSSQKRKTNVAKNKTKTVRIALKIKSKRRLLEYPKTESIREGRITDSENAWPYRIKVTRKGCLNLAALPHQA